MIIGLSLVAVASLWYWNRRLHTEIMLRKKAESALLDAQEKLADRVHERTRELAGANAALKREMKEKEKLLKKLHRSEKMEALGLMAGGVAHDLNNILAGIVSYPDLLLVELPGDSPLREPLEVIKDSGSRAAAVVSDLLTIARGVALDKHPVCLNSLITECLESPEYSDLKSRFPHIHCTTTAASDLKNIFCSPVHIKKCLMNLLTNAFEAIGEKGTVVLTTENKNYGDRVQHKEIPGLGEWVSLSISDTGPGISAEDMEHVFEPFYSKKVMGRSGTGLGLAIVWNTMHDHDGSITVNSSGKGTVFTLFFPVTERQEHVPPGQISNSDLKGRGENILVVDDEPRQREIAGKVLTSLGYEVESVGSGEDALKFLQKKQVNLVILDMVMEPGMDGLQTYREILLRISPGQKAIIVSGFSENNSVVEAGQLGAAGFVKKPYTYSQLGLAVRQELRRST
jgi:signal transduction histidine kinase/CheY-like chemotaxis protein